MNQSFKNYPRFFLDFPRINSARELDAFNGLIDVDNSKDANGST